MSTFLTQGIILRRDHYSEYDWQYTIYTKDAGKVSAIVKSGKKFTSKLNSHLDYFLISDLMLAEGNNFKRIAAAQINKNFNKIKNDLKKIIIASYFLEVLDLLTSRDFCDFDLFLLTNNFLSDLNDVIDFKKEVICLNKYLFQLLSHLGYCPIIKSKTQKQLTRDLHKLILIVGEREVKSFNLLQKMI